MEINTAGKFGKAVAPQIPAFMDDFVVTNVRYTMIGLINTVLLIIGFVTFAIGWHQQTMFFKEWRDDVKHLPFTVMFSLSATALFSPYLSERCRKRRLKVIASTGVFFLTCLAIGIVHTAEG